MATILDQFGRPVDRRNRNPFGFVAPDPQPVKVEALEPRADAVAWKEIHVDEAAIDEY